MMVNHRDEETLNKLRRIILSLQNEIDLKNNKIMEMEYNHSETLATVRTIIIGLIENINSKERSLLEMECKYDECSSMVQKLRNERLWLQEGCEKEIQKLNVIISDKNHEMECLKKEHGKLTKQLEESKALNDMQHKNFIEEIQTLKRVLQNQCHVEIEGNLDTEITTFRNLLKDKMEYLELVENLNSSLIVKESQYKQEILDARTESLNSLRDTITGRGRSQLGIRRLGELDRKPFIDWCSRKYLREQREEMAAMLCSSWEENVMDSTWNPFKRIEDNGVLQVVIDENDEKLIALRNEYGERVYKAVSDALMEIEEYNPSGRYVISEIWNLKEERKATLKEIIQYLVRQLKKTHKKRKRT